MRRSVFELISFVFDGKAIEKGSMKVKDFAPSLLAFAETVEEANNLLSSTRSSVDIKITSEFKDGSFESVVAFVQYITDHGQQLITAIKDYSITDILEIIGYGRAASTPVISLIKLIKKIKGRKVIETKKLDDDRYAIIVDDGTGSTEEIIVTYPVYKLFTNGAIRDKLNSMLSPLKIKGYDYIQWKHKGKPIETINYDEAIYFKREDVSPEDMSTKPIDSLFRIRSLGFDRRIKWRIEDIRTGEKYSVRVVDNRFWQDVEKGRASFKKGDILQGQIASIEKVTRKRSSSEWQLITIQEHKRQHEQSELRM